MHIYWGILHEMYDEIKLLQTLRPTIMAISMDLVVARFHYTKPGNHIHGSWGNKIK